jgi:transcriptional regulator with XRE-family HTH domain
MRRLKRPELAAEAARRNREQLARAGAELRLSRRRRRLTQAQLGAIVGVAQSTTSRLERGLGGSLSMDVWQRAFTAVDRLLVVDPLRDPLAEPADAGHLRIQELVLRTARHAGLRATFELPSRPAESGRSTDVGLRNDRLRVLELIECWNVIGDIGAGARSTARKVADAEMVAVAVGTDRPYRVASCWVVRATRRNRELVARYPEVFARRFPGSSRAWAAAITTGSEPPLEPGLVWCDVGATRLFAWRRAGAASAA